MTEHDEKFLTDYRNADFNHRLNLYLQFPRLRSKFILIDRNELQTDVPTGFKLQRNSLATQLDKVINIAAINFKRFLGVGSV